MIEIDAGPRQHIGGDRAGARVERGEGCRQPDALGDGACAEGIRSGSEGRPDASASRPVSTVLPDSQDFRREPSGPNLV
ncbi:hypothetical protein GCM10023192_13670 [Amycolatopsis samaneae]